MSEERENSGRFEPGNDSGLATRYVAGQSGNPTGRPKGVTYPGDWIKGLCGLTGAEVRQIANDPAENVSRRMAARSVLRAVTQPDMADVEALFSGSTTLRELRDSGVDTSVIKRYRRHETGHGPQITVELHDWSSEINRVLDRTEGRPRASVTVEQKDNRTARQIIEDCRRAAGVAHI